MFAAMFAQLFAHLFDPLSTSLFTGCLEQAFEQRGHDEGWRCLSSSSQDDLANGPFRRKGTKGNCRAGPVSWPLLIVAAVVAIDSFDGHLFGLLSEISWDHGATEY
jgi:hypothetical protein